MLTDLVLMVGRLRNVLLSELIYMKDSQQVDHHEILCLRRKLTNSMTVWTWMKGSQKRSCGVFEVSVIIFNSVEIDTL